MYGKNISFFFFLIYILISCSVQNVPQQITAFPGAVGFGSKAVGGRGGEVIEVINLNDDGPGSFRSACNIKKPRIIIFKISGIIELQSDIQILYPYVTIAGQTALNEGITLKGGGLRISTHELIIRGLKIRPGFDAGKEQDGFSISANGKEIYNIIIGNCSVSWATDENIGINGRNGGIRNVTIQDCIISEGLLNHSMGLLINGVIGNMGATNITIYNNLFAHNNERNPMAGEGAEVEVINNLIYNWKTKASAYNDHSKANIIGNYFKDGRDTRGRHRAIELIDKPLVFLKGNVGPSRLSEKQSEAELINGDKSLVTNDPVIQESGIKYKTAVESYDFILKSSGAMPRDDVDSRIVNDVKKGSGKIIRKESEVGGYPKFSNHTSIKDSDQDGIPDKWEVSHGLDPLNEKDNVYDRNGDGYMNIEEYFNQLFLLEN